MDKSDHLHSLSKLYTRLAIFGDDNDVMIGVMAIQPIPAGVDPFELCRLPDPITLIHESELATLPQAIRNYIHDFIPHTNDGHYEFPNYPIVAIDQAYYLNHSATPNMVTTDGITFITARPIAVGEQLTVDYRTYTDTTNDDFVEKK